jgi:hypothetical protein
MRQILYDTENCRHAPENCGPGRLQRSSDSPRNDLQLTPGLHPGSFFARLSKTAPLLNKRLHGSEIRLIAEQAT